MKHFLLVVCLILVVFSSKAQQQTHSEITTYYLIRHAEKDRSDPSVKDVHLTEEGKRRAIFWDQVLQHVPFNAVYATNYNRTKETVLPTAKRNNLNIISYRPDNAYNEDFKKSTKGKTILIAGHSNTIPDFVNAIIGSKNYEEIEDDNNGNLYIVTIVNGKSTAMVLTINPGF